MVYEVMFHDVETGCRKLVSILVDFWIVETFSGQCREVLCVFVFGVVCWNVSAVSWDYSVFRFGITTVAVGLAVGGSPALLLGPVLEPRCGYIVGFVFLGLTGVKIKRTLGV